MEGETINPCSASAKMQHHSSRISAGTNSSVGHCAEQISWRVGLRRGCSVEGGDASLGGLEEAGASAGAGAGEVKRRGGGSGGWVNADEEEVAEECAAGLSSIMSCGGFARMWPALLEPGSLLTTGLLLPSSRFRACWLCCCFDGENRSGGLPALSLSERL